MTPKSIPAALAFLFLHAASMPALADDTETRRYATFDQRAEQVDFTLTGTQDGLRSYMQTSSAPQRDGAAQTLRYAEAADLPRVRSGSLAFDALFALATTEMRQASVAQIRDGSYNGGKDIACDCFETGEKWHYVWTRDLSYAAHLGLALLDPARVRNSLQFKLSGYRSGITKPDAVAGSADGLQIIQDTGSGGSWPVSSDRISWAFGAAAAMRTLPAAQRAEFAPRVLQALRNTLDNDRIALHDARDGLYRGEQSFLDWREQSYAAWIVNDIASLATSKSLSTNVGHYHALTLAAMLAAEQHDAALAARYRDWAAALKRAINGRFWQADTGLYSSITAGHFDGAPLHKYDWLGLSLAIITGVADARQAERILANYPHGPFGPPVIHPQQSDIAIYHNRAIWPFVTAYGLKAAIAGGNVSVADAAYDSLQRSAALHLSNMENLEWQSGQALLQDPARPALDGPVINSKRQLWSVGAYLGMVIENVFGIGTTNEGIHVAPFITSKLRRETFAGSSEILLDNLRLHGRSLRVQIRLPAAARNEGYYPVQAIRLNGKTVTAMLRWDQIAPDALLEIDLGELKAGKQAMRKLVADPYVQDARVFAPAEPALVMQAPDAQGRFAFDIVDERNPLEGTRYNIYRNGRLHAQNIARGHWRAPIPADGKILSCYAVEAVFNVSGNRSHRSAPRCTDAVLDIAVGDARIASNLRAQPADAAHAQPYLKQWGAAADTFSVRQIRVARAGEVHVQLAYFNTAHAINLGITSGVKMLRMRDAKGAIVAQQVVAMPHAAGGPAYSTPLSTVLPAGEYSLEMSDFMNMSYLASNAGYGDAGGVGGPLNRIDLAGVRLYGVARDQAAR